MEPLELAGKYMKIFFSGENLDELSQLLATEFTFNGPFYNFHSAKDYIASLKSDPARGCEYKIIHSFADKASACLFCQFTKPGVCVPMAQMFDVNCGKITRSLLIFDTGAFT